MVEEQREQEVQSQEQTVSEEEEQQVQEPGELDVVRKELDNLKSVLGRQGQEIGYLKNENALLKTRAHEVQSPQQGFQQAQQYPQDTTEEYDWTDSKSVDKRVNRAVGSMYQQIRQELARGAYVRGSNIVNQNPEFKGYEQDVKQLVEGWYGMNPNMPPDYLESPQTWYAGLDLIKGQKQRQNPQSVSPVSPTQTEVPSGQRRVEREPEPMQFDRGAQNLVEFFYSGDEKEASKTLREIRDDRERRNR